MEYGKLTHQRVDEEVLKLIQVLQKVRVRETTTLTNDEVVEEGLWLLLKAYEDIGHLVKDIDPDRFAPVRSISLQSQEMSKSRLNTCRICGHTRCDSDHK